MKRCSREDVWEGTCLGEIYSMNFGIWSRRQRRVDVEVMITHCGYIWLTCISLVVRVLLQGLIRLMFQYVFYIARNS